MLAGGTWDQSHVGRGTPRLRWADNLIDPAHGVTSFAHKVAWSTPYTENSAASYQNSLLLSNASFVKVDTNRSVVGGILLLGRL
jgi:hypothetical protein